jgi:integrase
MARQLVTVKPCIHPRYSWRVTYRQGEAYEQKYFRGKTEAKDFANDKRVELTNEGRKHGEFSDDERRAVILAREMAENFAASGVEDFTLESAVRFYAKHIEACGKSVSVLAAYDEYQSAKQRAGKSARYMRDIETRLLRFAKKHGKRLVAELSHREIESYLHRLEVGSVTMMGHHRMIHGFLGWCVSRGYAPANCSNGFEKPKIVGAPPGILSPEQAAALLASAPVEIVSALAIGLFAGLRSAEIERLDWKEIDLTRGFIEVTAQNAKTSKRRLVAIPPNLKAFLTPHARICGPVRPSSQIYRDRLEIARMAAGLKKWPSNACRHSFASYHLARGQDAAATALQLGHTNTTVLFQHYRELARPEEGEAYFAIMPHSTSAENIVPFATEDAA